MSILSIHPYQATASNKLLRTELFMLIYWAKRYATRVELPDDLPVSAQTDPLLNDPCLRSQIRLLSICDNRARFVYAAFSCSYLMALFRTSHDIKRHPVAPPPSCRIHIEKYRELTNKADLKAVIQELADEPIGTSGLSKQYEKREQRKREKRRAAKASMTR